MEAIGDFLADLLEREAARVIAAAGAGATAAALFIAGQLGVQLSPEFVAGVAAFAAVVATELIRHFVYSVRTHQAELAAAATKAINGE